jgi:hypothetical protein
VCKLRAPTHHFKYVHEEAIRRLEAHEARSQDVSSCGYKMFWDYQDSALYLINITAVAELYEVDEE